MNARRAQGRAVEKVRRRSRVSKRKEEILEELKSIFTRKGRNQSAAQDLLDLV